MTKFNVVYRPIRHNGELNTKGLVLNYEIYAPEEGFGNTRTGEKFAGFKAKQTNGQTRSFRFNRLVAMVPAS